MKFNRYPELADYLAPLIAAQVQTAYRLHDQKLPDLVISMPLARSSWRTRGFNQAERLALPVGRLLGLRYQGNLVRRFERGGPQHLLTAAQRWQNLSRAMQCGWNLTGLHIAVVDDVITTTASMQAVARALKRRGAIRVDGWAVAYTPPPEVHD